MLQTLLKLGQQGERNLGEWDDLLKAPTVETENKRKELITSYCLSVRFDLDALEVSLGDLREYDDKESWRRWFNLTIGAANNPSIYVCVDGRKNLSQFVSFPSK